MKNCKSKKKKRIKILIVIVIIFLLIFGYFNFYVNPTICKAHTEKVKSTTIGLIDEAIYNTISQNDYDDLVTISKDSNGKIVMMQVNSKNANKLNNDIVTDIQTKLNSTEKIELSLPLGNFSGIPTLSGIGPLISLNIVPIGNVHTNYNSQFVSVGINQSYHKIYINIAVEVCILLPLYSHNVVVKNQVLVTETIIVGEVPATYLNTDNLTNALNLIP